MTGVEIKYSAYIIRLFIKHPIHNIMKRNITILALATLTTLLTISCGFGDNHSNYVPSYPNRSLTHIPIGVNSNLPNMDLVSADELKLNLMIPNPPQIKPFDFKKLQFPNCEWPLEKYDSLIKQMGYDGLEMTDTIQDTINIPLFNDEKTNLYKDTSIGSFDTEMGNGEDEDNDTNE